MFTSGGGSILDIIKRTYLNGAGDIIATQYISVRVTAVDGLNVAGQALVNVESINPTRFRRVGIPHLKTVRSPKASASAVVATITTEGSFDSRSESGGDVVSVTYTGSTSDVNDLIIPVNALSGVFKVGDTV